MAPKDLLRFFDRLRIKEDNRFEEISEQKIFTPKLGACVDTVFLEKNVSKGIRRSRQGDTKCNWLMEKGGGWSTGFADGQGSSNLSMGQRVMADSQPED
jgi:hypothetical protein